MEHYLSTPHMDWFMISLAIVGLVGIFQAVKPDEEFRAFRLWVLLVNMLLLGTSVVLGYYWCIANW